MAKRYLMKNSLEEEEFGILKSTFSKKIFNAQYNARKLTSVMKVSNEYLRIIITVIIPSQV